LETVDRATGILKVQDPNGDWHEAKEPLNISTGGGQQTWVYPDDFKDGDTQTAGPYNVVAEVTFPDVTWTSKFQVGFFATVPEVPLGTIVVAFATFGALGIFTLRKRFSPRMRF